MAETVFIECVSCGNELVLHASNHREADRTITDWAAGRIAHSKGWTVRGHYGAKRTRCPACRRKGVRHTRAADEGRIGNKAGYQTSGRARHG